MESLQVSTQNSADDRVTQQRRTRVLSIVFALLGVMMLVSMMIVKTAAPAAVVAKSLTRAGNKDSTVQFQPGLSSSFMPKPESSNQQRSRSFSAFAPATPRSNGAKVAPLKAGWVNSALDQWKDKPDAKFAEETDWMAGEMVLDDSGRVTKIFAKDGWSIEGEDLLLPVGKSIKLNDGTQIPQYGLGTYRVLPHDTYDMVRMALAMGYTMIDTAEMYMNEAEVAKAIVDSGIPREKLFVTTKIYRDGRRGTYQAQQAATRSLQRMAGIGYVDLLLLHSPGNDDVEAYDALLEMKAQGLTKSVGVSNFNIGHLEELRRQGRPPPAVNQIEMHPVIFPKRKALAEYCARHDILVQAYGSLMSGTHHSHGTLAQVAATHERTSGQVLLRWALQKGFQVIPKSLHPQRLRENQGIFDFQLSTEEVRTLEDTMSRDIGSLQVYWNPVEDMQVSRSTVTQVRYRQKPGDPSWGTNEGKVQLEERAVDRTTPAPITTTPWRFSGHDDDVDAMIGNIMSDAY